MFRRFFSTSKKLPYNQPWAMSEDGGVKCEPLTKKSFDGALQVMRQSFLKDEPICKAVGILNEPEAAEELLQTFYDAAKDGVSFVAIETSTNEVVGVMFNKIQVRAPKGESYYENLRKQCKYKSLKAFYDFTIDVETKTDIFKRYNTNCLVEIMSGATKPHFKQRNVAILLFSAFDKMGRLLCNGKNVKTPVDIEDEDITNAIAIPSVAIGLATSIYTQKTSEKFGYDNIFEVSYDEYTFDGKKFSERIGDVHKTCRVIVKRLDGHTVIL